MAKISTRNITDENVDDIMTTAAYGAITYWAEEPTQADFDAAKPDQHVIRVNDEDDYDGPQTFWLTPAKIRQAIVEVAEGRHTNDTIAGYVRQAFRDWTAEDGIDTGDIDADAADCIVQVACFGEVVYG